MAAANAARIMIGRRVALVSLGANRGGHLTGVPGSETALSQWQAGVLLASDPAGRRADTVFNRRAKDSRQGVPLALL